MAETPGIRKRRSSLPVKIVVVLVVLAGLSVLFVRSLQDARSTPYTVELQHLRSWTVVFEPAPDPAAPVLVLQPPPELVAGLFRQIFTRVMESLNVPMPAAIPLLLQGEFDSAFAGHATPEALAAAARDTGLESVAPALRCLAYRRVSEPGAIRQVFFVIVDVPAFTRFRERIGALARGGDFDPAALSPVLFVAASESSVGYWLPLRPNPASDCVAPIVTE